MWKATSGCEGVMISPGSSSTASQHACRSVARRRTVVEGAGEVVDQVA